MCILDLYDEIPPNEEENHNRQNGGFELNHVAGIASRIMSLNKAVESTLVQ